MGRFRTFILILMVSAPSSIYAVNFNDQFLKKNIGTFQRVEILPFSKHQGYGLRTSNLSVSEHLQQVLRQYGLDNFASFTIRSQRDHRGDTVSSFATYGIKIKGVNLCQFEVGAMLLNSGPYIIGDLPFIDDVFVPEVGDWPNLTEHLNDLKQSNDHLAGLSRLAGSESRCLWVDAGSLYPAWQFTMLDDEHRPYQVTLGSYQLYGIENKFLHAAAKVRIFKKNPIDARISTFEIQIHEGKKLENDYFITNPVGKNPAESSDLEFFFDQATPEFKEASVFGHANNMLSWFFKQGFSWQSKHPIEVRIHEKFSGNNVNNALYIPSVDGTAPLIKIGDGDGVVLRNLSVDSDVVSHELGHHIVYRTLTTVKGESLVLHEGLADYFAFAQSGDACLGESICPADSTACWTRGRCLRTGNNEIRYDDRSFLSMESHLKGQLISGFLLDMHDNPSIGEEVTISLVFEGLKLFLSNSGYRDFLLSLLLADKSLYNSSHACAIVDSATNRGFAEKLEGINCQDPDSFKEPEGNQKLAGETEDAPVNRSKSSRGGCGVIVGTTSSMSALWLFFLPIIMVAIRREKKEK